MPKTKTNTADTGLLDEAAKLISGERMDQYGPPTDSLKRMADFWTIILRDKLKPRTQITSMDVAMCMISFKLSRQINSNKHDNLVDIAGYAAIADLL